MSKNSQPVKTLISLRVPKLDRDYLKKTIYDLSVLDENTNQTELYSLGLYLLQKLKPQDLQKRLHEKRKATA